MVSAESGTATGLVSNMARKLQSPRVQPTCPGKDEVLGPLSMTNWCSSRRVREEGGKRVKMRLKTESEGSKGQAKELHYPEGRRAI